MQVGPLIMPYECHLVEKGKRPKGIGDMWYAPEYLEPPLVDELSDQYVESWMGKREPIVVTLPDKTRFCIDQRSTKAREAGTHEGWSVTGVPPALSCTPSIQITIGLPGSEIESYHGLLTNGILS